MSYEVIGFSVLIIVIVLLVINNIRLQIRNQKLVLKNAQDFIDRNIVIDKLKEEIQKNNNSSLEKTDGFLKFISESRDWAFKYIEDVQAELLSFKNVIEPKLEYAEKYIRLGGQTPAMATIDEISVAYQKLKRIMPEEDEK